MCLVEIPQALHKILDLPMITDLQKPVLPTRNNQKWEKIKLNVRLYLKDILQVYTIILTLYSIITPFDTFEILCIENIIEIGANAFFSIIFSKVVKLYLSFS